MSLLHPRAAYQRANSDEPDARQDYTVELSSINTPYTASSATKDLLPKNGIHEIQSESNFSFFRSLRGRLHGDSHGFHGWRVGALSAAGLAFVSFLLNVAVVSWLGSLGKGAGLIEVYKGSCDKVQQLDIWTHLGINALSTLLLGGSNYCMQCLCAPTRAEVDLAHSRGKWLDIGVPSVRNLKRVSRRKTYLWWMLALSSIPLHLMYNSVFYKSLSTNDYDLFFVKQAFVDGGNFTVTEKNTARTWNQDDPEVHPADVQHVLLSTDRYERLDPAACISSYGTNFLTDRRNLVLVSSNGTRNNSLLYMPHYTYSNAVDMPFGKYKPFDWICQSDPNIDSKIEVPNDGTDPYYGTPPCATYLSLIVGLAEKGQWAPHGFDVQYCLSERVPETCSYSGSIPILIVVIVCNACKIIGMLVVAFGLQDNPLITVGDAVDSFLNQPDETTKGWCLLSKSAVREHLWPLKSATEHPKILHDPRLSTARLQTIHWARAASLRRWSFTVAFILFALALIGGLLKPAMNAISTTGQSILSLGIGRVDGGAIIQGWSVSTDGPPAQKIIGSILIANIPQAILSFIYLHVNGLLTTMFLASEYLDFAAHRKGLRVSIPKADTAQRSTYFLQLPYRIAIPLMALSGILHWLVSQSIFLAVVAEYASTGVLTSSVAVASCGFSPLAMILVLALGGGIIITTVVIGRLRFRSTGMPLAGSCSAAISAACHRPSWDTDAATKAVRWGVIPGSENGNVATQDEIGHCSFTSGEVGEVENGALYA